MKIHCLYSSLIPISDLRPHPKNRNKHGQDQIERLAKLLQAHGMRAPIVVSNLSGYIVKGHGTVLALKHTAQRDAPVVYQDFESEEEEYQFLQADNAIASWAELDLKGIHLDLPDLAPFDIDLLGIKNFQFEPTDSVDPNNPYIQSVESPIYCPSGVMPQLGELTDRGKVDGLIEEINKSGLSSEEKGFLIMAAYRHTVFNYKNIAEYYAHASIEMQDFMEKSALVIVDFKKAIENGFVMLSSGLAGDFDAA